MDSLELFSTISIILVFLWAFWHSRDIDYYIIVEEDDYEEFDNLEEALMWVCAGGGTFVQYHRRIDGQWWSYNEVKGNSSLFS